MKYETYTNEVMSILEIYDDILDGRIEKFPRGFWKQGNSREYAILVVKHLLEDILQFTRDDICNKVNQKLFYRYKLKGMLLLIFNNSPLEAIQSCYPNKFLAWELTCNKRAYWTKQVAIEATKWLIEKKLNYTSREQILNISYRDFKKYNLSGMLSVIYDNSAVRAVVDAYPDSYKEWQFKHTPKGYWNLSTSREVVKHLVEVILKLNPKTELNKVTLKDFKEHNLEGMLQIQFKHNYHRALKFTYDDIYVD